jgi:hypothetical protein
MLESTTTFRCYYQENQMVFEQIPHGASALTRSLRWAAVSALVAGSAAVAAPATAEPFDLVFPAGTACAVFDVGVNVAGSAPELREFRDKNGDVVRTLQTGTGNQLTFTNVATGESLELDSNGTATRTTIDADGNVVEAMGHNVIILFPSDTPAGPSTELFVGRIVYTVDATNTFVVQSSAGRRVDLCAALSA